MRIKRTVSLGVSIQHYAQTLTDEFSYPGLLLLSNGEWVSFPELTEKHWFESKTTHILAFFDYSFFANGILVPTVGVGLGLTASTLEWNWEIQGSKIANNTLYRAADDQSYMDVGPKKHFAWQPRFRLEYSFRTMGGLGRFIDGLFVQSDYIVSQYETDYFSTYRHLALEDEPFESLPEELQTENIRKLYDNYDVKTGGLQFMIGIRFKFDVPVEDGE